MNYSLEGDPELYLAHDEAGYQEKLYNEIKGQRPIGWTKEINNLTDDGRGAGLLNVFLRSGFIDEKGALTFSGEEIMNLPPDDLEGIFLALNKLDLGGDILPNALQDVLSSVGLTKFTRPEEAMTVEPAIVGGDYSYDLGAVAGNMVSGGHPLTISLDKLPSEYSLKAIDLDIDYTDFIVTSNPKNIDVSALSGHLVFTANESLEVKLTYDLSSYRYTQAELGNKDIDLIINLLESIYTEGEDGQSGSYFDFGSVPDGYDVMTAFTEEGHHTYNLLTYMQQTSIFENPVVYDGDSDAYYPTLNSSANTFTSRDYALYHIFTLDLKFDSSADQETPKASIFNRLDRHDRSMVGAIKALNSALGKEGKYPDLTADSLYVDDHIVDLAFVEGYVLAIESLTKGLGDDQTAKETVNMALIGLNQSARIPMVTAVDAFSPFASVDEKGVLIGKPVLFNNILAGEMDAIYNVLVNTDHINHNVGPGTNGANPSGLYTNADITADSYETLGSFYEDWMELIYEGSAQKVFYGNLMAYAFTDESIASNSPELGREGLEALEELHTYFKYAQEGTVFVSGKEKLAMLSSYLYLSLPYSGIASNPSLSSLTQYNDFKVGDSQVDFVQVAEGLASYASISIS